MENKKIKNASECEYNGIHFKSNFERDCYKVLQSEGLNPQYESQTFHIWSGKNFSVPCYDVHTDRKLKKKVWGINSYKPMAIKYTPDFIFHINDSLGTDRMIIVESKGFPNDRYIYVKKMFRSYLEENHPQSVFFEVYNKKQLKSAIEIINNLKNQEQCQQ